MKFSTRQLLAWAGLVAAMGAAGASAQGARTIDAGGGLYLSQVGPRVVVREPSGEIGELSLPPGTSARRLAPLTGGWLIAGEVDASGFSELFLLREVDGVRGPVPAPANEAGDTLRAGPLPLVEGGRLVGLAWLAGAGVRQTAVWASSWDGLDWSPPELVSPVGAGTQIAIDGAVLADGSWLLVWSAHDGQDDEILWSRRTDGTWTAPRVLHDANDTPDITPALVAAGPGALAAWSRFDGTAYRVALAAFAEGDWRVLETAGRAAAVRPGLTIAGDRVLLLYRTAVPPTWTLEALDERGAVLRRAVVEEPSTLRPALVLDGEASAALEWPGERAATPRRIEAAWQPEP